MSKKKLIQLLFLNVGIILVNVILFSRGLVGLKIGEEILPTALGVTVIVMSVIAFFWGNISILFTRQKPVIYKGNEFGDDRDYLNVLEEKNWKTKVFRESINKTMEQLDRLHTRNEALNSILLQHFSPREMTFQRFHSVIDSVNELFRNNVKKMINRMEIFDEEDYRVVVYKIRNNRSTMSEQESQTWYDKLNIYMEHIHYVEGLVEANEGIIVKLDKLMLELTKLDDFNENNIESMSAVQEINDLISQTKFYKQ